MSAVTYYELYAIETEEGESLSGTIGNIKFTNIKSKMFGHFAIK